MLSLRTAIWIQVKFKKPELGKRLITLMEYQSVEQMHYDLLSVLVLVKV